MNQKPLRTLFFWAVWVATSITLYTTIYTSTGTDVWSYIEHDASRITWLILGAFVLAIVVSLAVAIIITLETIAADRAENKIKASGLGNHNPPHPHRAVHRFFNALKFIIDTNGDIDVENLLHVELAALYRISHTVEVVGNILITLGLVGTVMGLTMVLTGLTSSLNALGHDQELLMSSLHKAMEGMGTAFYTTLLGAVLGGILLRIFAQITENGIDGLHDQIMRTVLVYCATELKPTMQRDVRGLGTEIDMLNNKIHVLEQLMQNSRQALSQFHDELTRLRSASRAESETMLQEIQHHIRCSELLRDELKLLNKLRRPWWERVKAYFRPTKSE